MDAADAASAALAIAQSNHINRIFSAVAFAILYYDFVLTIPLDVERYWTGGWSWSSSLYFLNRYLSVLSHVPVIIEFFVTIHPTLQMYHQIIAAFTHGVVAGLLTIRTYALYTRNKHILYLLLTICACGGIISLWAILSVRAAHTLPRHHVPHSFGCDLMLSDAQGRYLAAAWASILVFDATVFTLTLTMALRVGQTWSGSLFNVILRDGTMYFGILMLCYLANIMTYVFGEPMFKGVSSTLTNVIAATLITRLMLNIRDPVLVDGSRRWSSEERIDLALPRHVSNPNPNANPPRPSTGFEFAEAAAVYK